MTITLPTLKWAPSPNYSTRSAPIDLIVLHDCEGSYAGACNWFANPMSKVSAHIVLKEDGTEACQMVSFEKNAWHCKAFNSRSIGVEMGGMARRGFPDIEWATAANVLAYLLHTYKLPVQWARGGHGPGFCRHFDLGLAGGGHQDPTTDDAIWTAFVTRVQAVSAAGVAPWGRGLPPSAEALSVTTTAQADPPHGIAWAQTALNGIGFKPSLTVDGSFGPKTQDALARFQASHGLFADGFLGPETIRALKPFGA